MSFVSRYLFVGFLLTLRTDWPLYERHSQRNLLHYGLQSFTILYTSVWLYSHVRYVIRLNSCYYYRDLHQWYLHFLSRKKLKQYHCAFLHIVTKYNGKGEVLRFSVIHFQGFFIRWLGCYTILRGCRLPWPPCHCLNEKTPFMVSDERKFDTFPFN